jgi:fatty-acyl-CoA synthase
VESGRTFSYRDFNRAANRFRAFLRELGVQPGDRVSVLLPNGADLLFALFGCTKLGAIFVPLNFKLAAPELAAILSNARPALLLYAAEFEALASAACADLPGLNITLLDDAVQRIAAYSDKNPSEIFADLEEPQMLLYTSGTTGTPKGVIISHRHVLWNAINSSVRMITADDTVLIHTPMFYTGGLNVYSTPCCFLGATVCILKQFSPEQVLEQVARLRITAFFAVPTQLLRMADSATLDAADLSSLRYVITGGAPCPVPLIERWNARGVTLRQGFGMTEVGPNAFSLDGRDAVRKAGSIGFPSFSIESRIVDDAGRDVPAGATGELILRTPAMCSGYWNNPEQSAAAIRGEWLYTGDLARQDDEGYFYVVDRKKDMFISGGENIYPAEIERVLAVHPKIAEVAVIGTPDARWGEVGCAIILLKAGEAMQESEVVEFCAGRIAKFKIPKLVRFVADVPRTVTGKIQKNALRKQI